MTKGKHGNKEVKKPKKVVVPPAEAAAALSSAPAVAPQRGKKR